MDKHTEMIMEALLWALSFALILASAWAFLHVTPLIIVHNVQLTMINTWSTLVSWVF